MNDIESRLRDLRQATAGRVRPSPELWAHIDEARTPRTWVRWTQAVAVAAVAAVLFAVVLLRPEGNEQQVTSRPPTAAEYVAAMNERCAEYIREAGEVVVVFPTPEAYQLAARNRIDALDRSLERFRAVGTPADAPGLLERVTEEAAAAQAAARAALTAAQEGDTATAAASLAAADDTVNRIGRLLAGYGAEGCRPPGTP